MGVICDGKRGKILQPIARVASIYCRIDYKLDLSNRHEIVLQIW